MKRRVKGVIARSDELCCKEIFRSESRGVGGESQASRHDRSLGPISESVLPKFLSAALLL